MNNEVSAYAHCGNVWYGLAPTLRTILILRKISLPQTQAHDDIYDTELIRANWVPDCMGFDHRNHEWS